MKRLDQWRVLIVGLGQIGGSLGLDLVEREVVADVIGYDIDTTTMQEARHRRAVHNIVGSLEEGVRSTDLVILAVPIRVVPQVMSLIVSWLKTDAAVLDVAGTKTEILDSVGKIEPPINYIGGHPMAGTEEVGLSAARAGLFDGTTFVLTPSPDTSEAWLPVVRELVTRIGASPIVMTAEDHDRLIALTSHLPHVLALALSNLARKHHEHDDRTLMLAGGSFESATRVAASSPELILDMFLTNREPIGLAIGELIAELTKLQADIKGGEELALRSLIDRVQSRRSGSLRS